MTLLSKYTFVQIPNNRDKFILRHQENAVYWASVVKVYQRRLTTSLMKLSLREKAPMQLSITCTIFFFNPRCQRNVHIHADNCSRQSKNSCVIGYYCWRVLCGYHNSVLYSFLSVGHTKFSPDWCFGVVK